jgi:hypothetical protein
VAYRQLRKHAWESAGSITRVCVRPRNEGPRRGCCAASSAASKPRGGRTQCGAYNKTTCPVRCASRTRALFPAPAVFLFTKDNRIFKTEFYNRIFVKYADFPEQAAPDSGRDKRAGPNILPVYTANW